jgi:hypothetical protein
MYAVSPAGTQPLEILVSVAIIKKGPR